MKHLILLTLFFSLSATTMSCAQSKTTQKEKFQPYYSEVKALVQSKDYKFVGEVVYNNKERSRLESNTNTISIVQNEASGQVSSIDTPKKSMELNGMITNYSVNFNDDSQEISIEFSIDEKDFYIDIKPNGNAFLAIKYGVNNITQVGKIIKI